MGRKSQSTKAQPTATATVTANVKAIGRAVPRNSIPKPMVRPITMPAIAIAHMATARKAGMPKVAAAKAVSKGLSHAIADASPSPAITLRLTPVKSDIRGRYRKECGAPSRVAAGRTVRRFSSGVRSRISTILCPILRLETKYVLINAIAIAFPHLCVAPAAMPGERPRNLRSFLAIS